MKKILKRFRLPRQETSAELLRRHSPHIVHLRHMRQDTYDDLPTSALKSSLARLAYIGGGTVIYYLKPDTVHIGRNSQLRDYAILEVGGKLEIGEGCVIGAYNWIQASGSVTLGDGVIMGPHTSLISTSHQHTDPESKVADTPLLRGSVTVGNNVWIGAHVTVLMGVTIGDNTTIGSGSVVTRDIPANSVAFGNPCRVHRRK